MKAFASSIIIQQIRVTQFFSEDFLKNCGHSSGGHFLEYRLLRDRPIQIRFMESSVMLRSIFSKK